MYMYIVHVVPFWLHELCIFHSLADEHAQDVRDRQSAY